MTARRFIALVTLTFALLCRWQISAADTNLENGKRAYKQGDYGTALKQLTPLAEQGNSDAQVILGMMTLRGQGVGRDVGRAMKWFTAAAAHGNAEGQFYVGSLYFMGAGVPHDSAKGLKWLGKSADQGNSDSQVFLGLIYFQGGGGVARDLVQADMWFHLAAERGDPLAPQQVEAAEKQMTSDELASVKALIAAWKPKTSAEPDAGKKE